MQLEGHFRTSGGKLISATDEAGSIAAIQNRRLFVGDKTSGDRYLIDTGASISVIPARRRERNHPASFTLFAANGTPIKTFGEITKTLDLGLRRPLRWTFLLADVDNPIIGADFLFHHHILVDLNGRQLIDSKTGLTSKGSLRNSTTPSLYAVPCGEWYYELLRKYPAITRPSAVPQKPMHPIKHFIETKGAPVTSKARRLPPDRYNAAREEFLKMVDEGICRPSSSPWASPLHIVKKKNGTLRFCGDYRRLNAQTLPDRYSVPNIQALNTNLFGKKVFSKIDLNKAYYQVPMAEEDIPKTAVITPFGLFEFLVMCFGLRNAAQTFQRLMDSILALPYVFVYIDDILVASASEEEHRVHLEEVFRRLSQHGLTINPQKSEFCKTEVEFLGFLVDSQGIKPLPGKVDQIADFPRPTTKGHLRRFLGMINFYRRCLPKAAEVQRLLHALIGNSKKNDSTPIEWTPEAEEAFVRCQQDIKDAVTLAHPSSDAELSLACDASNTAVGAVLQQREGEHWRPLGFFSRALTSAQQRYSAYDRELTAIYCAVKHFRPLIEGRTFSIFTDHKPLVYSFYQKSETATPMRIRYVNFISQFTSDIRHVSGEENKVADTLSRLEGINSPDDTGSIVQAQQEDSSIPELLRNPSLQLKLIELPHLDKPLLCDFTTPKARPYIPPSLRQEVFRKLHCLSHPGVRGTRRLVSQRFFWPNMNADLATWTRQCIACQRSKTHRHTVTPPGVFAPAGRFEHVHVDIIGPLPPSDGKRYCLTMADRYSRWPEAEPIEDISAKTVAAALYRAWISRFGVPARITTDQGRQFESELFSRLLHLLGARRCRTTAYHPQSNGVIERWHRTLKTALTAHLINSNSWTELLPTVLLGLRVAIRDDNSTSAAELTYGQPLRLPGELLETTTQPDEPDEFLRKLRENLQRLQPAPYRISPTPIFTPKNLKTCSHVFLRDDAVRRPLTPPYTGPHLVLERGDKTFVIVLGSGKKTVSIDRLKPAHVLEDLTDTSAHMQSLPPPAESPSENAPATEADQPSSTNKTRRGRLIRPPVRFCDGVIGGR